MHVSNFSSVIGIITKVLQEKICGCYQKIVEGNL